MLLSPSLLSDGSRCHNHHHASSSRSALIVCPDACFERHSLHSYRHPELDFHNARLIGNRLQTQTKRKVWAASGMSNADTSRARHRAPPQEAHGKAPTGRPSQDNTPKKHRILWVHILGSVSFLQKQWNTIAAKAPPHRQSSVLVVSPLNHSNSLAPTRNPPSIVRPGLSRWVWTRSV